VDILIAFALLEEKRRSKGLVGLFAGEPTPEWFCIGKSVPDTLFSSSSLVIGSFFRSSERVRSVIESLREGGCVESDGLEASLILDII
jgi:hypothetical protein